MWIANSLELGPGIRLLAPSKSKNDSQESHRRLRTSSSSIIAMCAAGPPNAVVPSRRKNSASSPRETRFFSGGKSEVCREGDSPITSVSSSRQSRVQRPRPTANQQQKNETQQHAHVRARFMQRAPKPVLRERHDFG